jgi:hypothetical protein
MRSRRFVLTVALALTLTLGIAPGFAPPAPRVGPAGSRAPSAGRAVTASLGAIGLGPAAAWAAAAPPPEDGPITVLLKMVWEWLKKNWPYIYILLNEGLGDLHGGDSPPPPPPPAGDEPLTLVPAGAR